MRRDLRACGAKVGMAPSATVLWCVPQESRAAATLESLATFDGRRSPYRSRFCVPYAPLLWDASAPAYPGHDLCSFLPRTLYALCGASTRACLEPLAATRAALESRGADAGAGRHAARGAPVSVLHPKAPRPKIGP